jgi:hypothetical protein
MRYSVRPPLLHVGDPLPDPPHKENCASNDPFTKKASNKFRFHVFLSVIIIDTSIIKHKNFIVMIEWQVITLINRKKNEILHILSALIKKKIINGSCSHLVRQTKLEKTIEILFCFLLLLISQIYCFYCLVA